MAVEWLEKETVRLEGIKRGSLILHIDGRHFEVSFTTPLKKVLGDALKLDPYEKSSNTVLIDGEEKILLLTFRRFGQILLILWEERETRGNGDNDIVEVLEFPFSQFRTDLRNTFAENAEVYKLEFENYRDL